VFSYIDFVYGTRTWNSNVFFCKNMVPNSIKLWGRRSGGEVVWSTATREVEGPVLLLPMCCFLEQETLLPLTTLSDESINRGLFWVHMYKKITLGRSRSWYPAVVSVPAIHKYSGQAFSSPENRSVAAHVVGTKKWSHTYSPLRPGVKRRKLK
jgi:hypothetical protein